MQAGLINRLADFTERIKPPLATLTLVKEVPDSFVRSVRRGFNVLMRGQRLREAVPFFDGLAFHFNKSPAWVATLSSVCSVSVTSSCVLSISLVGERLLHFQANRNTPRRKDLVAVGMRSRSFGFERVSEGGGIQTCDIFGSPAA